MFWQKRIPMVYNEAELLNRSVGDIFMLAGHKVRLTKKTTTAIAVEPYGWGDWVEDKFLDAIEWIQSL